MKFSFVFAAVVLTAGVARGNPRPLPMTYTTDTLPKGGVEIEQFVDVDPVKTLGATGDQWLLTSAFQTEIEIGLADRLELGLYMTFVPQPSVGLFPLGYTFPGEGNGLKQRIRYIFADQNEWPVDVGVYVEVTETEREVELEGKVLLQRRFGDLRLAANLSSEYEFYLQPASSTTTTKQREYVLNPSLGATYEISPNFHVGLDSFLRGEYPQVGNVKRTFGLGPAAYVGPAVMMNFGKLWWAVGAYRRVTDFDHTMKDGEPYGPYWFRSMIGFEL